MARRDSCKKQLYLPILGQLQKTTHREKPMSRCLVSVFTATALGLFLAGGQATAAPKERLLASIVRSGDIDALRREETALAPVIDSPLPPTMLTAVTIAAARGDRAMVEALLQAGANPNARWNNLPSALSGALRACKTDRTFLEYLVKAGADLEQSSGVGVTPLLFAVQENQTELAIVLLDLGADPFVTTPFGDGILNYAIYQQNNRLVREALARGVGPGQLNVLFTTVDYDPPGYRGAVPHHDVLCE